MQKSSNLVPACGVLVPEFDVTFSANYYHAVKIPEIKTKILRQYAIYEPVSWFRWRRYVLDQLDTDGLDNTIAGRRDGGTTSRQKTSIYNIHNILSVSYLIVSS